MKKWHNTWQQTHTQLLRKMWASLDLRVARGTYTSIDEAYEADLVIEAEALAFGPILTAFQPIWVYGASKPLAQAGNGGERQQCWYLSCQRDCECRVDGEAHSLVGIRPGENEVQG